MISVLKEREIERKSVKFCLGLGFYLFNFQDNNKRGKQGVLG